jgi:hypothetical protein
MSVTNTNVSPSSTPPAGRRIPQQSLNTPPSTGAGRGTIQTRTRLTSGGISYPNSTPTTTATISSFSTPQSKNSTYNSSSPAFVMSRSPCVVSNANTVSMRSQHAFSNSQLSSSNGVSVTTTSTNTNHVPNHLPPKSPASINNRMLLTVGSAGSSSSSHNRGSSPSRGREKGRRRGRSRSNSRRRRRSNSRSCSRNKDPLACDDNEADQLPSAPANAGSVSVDTDSDDLSSAEDFSLITFNTKSNTDEHGNIIHNSPTSVVSQSVEPFTRVVDHCHNIPQRSTRHHRRNRSWDSLGSFTDSSMAAGSSPSVAGASTKSCLALPKILQRNRQRVQVADVASVGNASDTLVPAENGRITGRELHESAKALLNDGDYEQALNMFSAILNAQIDRFGKEEHSSVGAALHNVGVVRLRMGDHVIAEEVLLRAVAIRRKVLGPEHLDLSVRTNRL